jgi:prepilin-type N-terminal cleavage/methylation domain-containing protein
MKSTGRSGFSLIELMIAVAIIGILSSLAIPTFRAFVLRSKTGEATENLGAMFKSAAVYYTIERASQGQSAGLTVGCTVGDIGPLPGTPLAQKQRLPSDDGFRALGFSVAEYIYYSYGLFSKTGVDACGGTANETRVYTLFAQGDLDGDKTFSTFELAVGSDANNELFHARGMYVEHELE